MFYEYDEVRPFPPPPSLCSATMLTTKVRNKSYSFILVSLGIASPRPSLYRNHEAPTDLFLSILLGRQSHLPDPAESGGREQQQLVQVLTLATDITSGDVHRDDVRT